MRRNEALTRWLFMIPLLAFGCHSVQQKPNEGKQKEIVAKMPQENIFADVILQSGQLLRVKHRKDSICVGIGNKVTMRWSSFASAPGLNTRDKGYKPLILASTGECELGVQDRAFAVQLDECNALLVCNAIWQRSMSLVYLVGGLCADRDVSLVNVEMIGSWWVPFDVQTGSGYYVVTERSVDDCKWIMVSFSIKDGKYALGDEVAKLECSSSNDFFQPDSLAYFSIMEALCEQKEGRK